MAGIFGVTVFNDDIFNTGAVAAGKVGGSYDGWLQDAPVTVKPWKDKPEEKYEDSPLELLIVATPRMGQLFAKDITGLPTLRQYQSQIYDIKFQATLTGRPFDKVKLEVQPLIANRMAMAQVESPFSSPQLHAEPKLSQQFNKTLYGKKLHGVALMRMAVELLEEADAPAPESFVFDEPASDWRGSRQYNDAAKILTFSHSSSFVGQVVYEKATKEMLLVLGDAIYNFCGVTRAIYDGFRKAGSKGRFFNQSIKGLWDC